MQQIITNKYLSVSILEKGIEISSIKSRKTGKEYMWDANPDIWGSHAPILFPIIGALKNNECSIDGTIYKIPKHGFIRHNDDIVIINKKEYQIDFQLEYSEKTLQMFPYKFQFNISFKLEKNKLKVSHQVKNLDDKEIHFSLGGHPGFKCPLNNNEEYKDYYLEFEHNETTSTFTLSSDGLISDSKEQVLTGTNILPLHNDLFNKDALIFKNLKSRKVSLKSNKSNQVLTVSFKDFNYLGIWAKPNAPFVCIEPWLGIADHENTDGDFLKKDGLITLPIGEVFNAEYIIEIRE